MFLQSRKFKPYKPLFVQREIFSAGVKINHLKSKRKKLSHECFEIIAINNKKCAPKSPLALSEI